MVGGDGLARLRAEHTVDLRGLPAGQLVIVFAYDGKEVLQKLHPRAGRSLAQLFGELAGDLVEQQAFAVELGKALDIVVDKCDAVPGRTADDAVRRQVKLLLEGTYARSVSASKMPSAG